MRPRARCAPAASVRPCHKSAGEAAPSRLLRGPLGHIVYRGLQLVLKQQLAAVAAACNHHVGAVLKAPHLGGRGARRLATVSAWPAPGSATAPDCAAAAPGPSLCVAPASG